MKKIRVAIVGSRSFSPSNDGVLGKQLIKTRSLINSMIRNMYSKPSKYEDQHQIIVVSGGAKGADTFAEHYADWEGYDIEIYKPDWDTHGNSAGYLRNAILVEKSDIIVAYWDGESKGTKHTIELSLKQRKPIAVIRYGDN